MTFTLLKRFLPDKSMNHWVETAIAKEGWPCTRESFSEFNRQSRNFQHSRFLVSTLGMLPPGTNKQEMIEPMGGGTLGSWFHPVFNHFSPSVSSFNHYLRLWEQPSICCWWADMEVPTESFHRSSWDSRTCYARRAFNRGLTDDCWLVYNCVLTVKDILHITRS